MAVKSFKVLVFGEEEGDLELYARLLADCPSVTFELARGHAEDPLFSCEASQPDAVILGFRGLSREGLAVLRSLRDGSSLPLWPIVMVTTHGPANLPINAINLGAQDYLEKDELSPLRLQRALHFAAERFRALRRARAHSEHLEIALDQMGQLQAMGAALARGITAGEVADTLLAQGRHTFGADSGIVLTLPEGSPVLRVLGSSNYPTEALAEWNRCSPTRALPVPDALAKGEAHFFENYESLVAAFPEIRPIADAYHLRAFMALPLKMGARVVASVGFGFQSPRSFTDSDKAFFGSVLQNCAQALDRAQFFDQSLKIRELLSKAVKARDEFLSIASHELKTPLTAIKLQLQLARRTLKSGNPDPAKISISYEVALRQVDRLSLFLEDLLDVSRLEAGKLILNLEAIDVSQLTQEVALRYKEQFENAGQKLKLEIEPQVEVRGDLFRFEQILNNLATNAIKYAGEAEITVRVQKVDGQAELCFADNGNGIPADRLPVIFDRFERAASSMHISGLGMGLYITKQLVEAHQGSIQVQSSLGEGTTFTMLFPHLNE